MFIHDELPMKTSKKVIPTTNEVSTFNLILGLASVGVEDI